MEAALAQGGCDLTFHGGGSQVAGTSGLLRGATGTRQTIMHQLQVWRVEGVRPRQVRYGREHPPAGVTESGRERDPAPGKDTGAPRDMPRLCALEEVTASSPGTPSPAGPTAKAAATRDSRLRAPHPPRRGPAALTCLRWRTPNRSLGKVAAHRGRMSSPPEDPCPSRGVTVTHAERHCATRCSFAERSAEPGRHRVLLATLSPSPSNLLSHWAWLSATGHR